MPTDLVFVATPTPTHLDVALPLLDKAKVVLVEKPLCHSPEAAELLQRSNVATGHSERFNPAVRALGEVRPRYVEAVRVMPATKRAYETDVVIDLMVHDLDLLCAWEAPDLQLADVQNVVRRDGKLDAVTVKLVGRDFVARLEVSRTAREKRRTVTVFERGQAHFLDLLQGTCTVRGHRSAPVDERDALTAQLDNLVAAALGESSLEVSAAHGLRALRAAEHIRSAVLET